MPRKVARQDLEPTEAGVDARREEILASAARLFAEGGYHATTIEDVAEDAGVAKGTVYWYFRSKKALFLAVLRTVSEVYRSELARAAEGIASPVGRLEAALRATFTLTATRPEVHDLYFQRVVDADEGFAGERERIHERLREDLAGLLEEAVRAGEVRDDDRETLVRMVMGAAEAAAGVAAARGSDEAARETAVRFIIEGLRRGR